MEPSHLLQTIWAYLCLEIFPSLHRKLLCCLTVFCKGLAHIAKSLVNEWHYFWHFGSCKSCRICFLCHHLVYWSDPIAYLTPFSSAPGDLSLQLFPLCMCCVKVHQYLLARTLPGFSPLSLVGSCCGGVAGLHFRPKPVAAVGGSMTDENDWGWWKHQLASTLLWRVLTWI